MGMRREVWSDMLGVWLPGVGGKCLGLVTGLSHDSDMWTFAPSEPFPSMFLGVRVMIN